MVVRQNSEKNSYIVAAKSVINKMERTITTILLLNPVYVALFWSIVLNLREEGKNRARSFLGKFMIVAFVTYMSHFFFFHRLYDIYIWLDCIYHLGSLSLYPMFYVYTLLLIGDERPSFRKHLRYFIAPLIVFLALSAGHIIMGHEKSFYYVSELLYGSDSHEQVFRYMQFVLKLDRIIFVIQASVYVSLIAVKTTRHHRLLWERYSSTEHMTLKWIQGLNYTLFISVLATTVFQIMGRISFVDNPLKLAIPTLTISVLVFILGVLGNRQKQVIIRESNDNRESAEVIDAKMPPRLKDELVTLFEKRQVYLEKDLTIWDVAERLGSNRTYVSRIINRDFRLTFSAFVNNHRVECAKRLLDKSEDSSAEELADSSGFGSANSLYRAFRASEKGSLAEYRRTLKSRRKGHNGEVT